MSATRPVAVPRWALAPATLGNLLVASERVASETTKLEVRVLHRRLAAVGIDASAPFNFPEWFCYVNESADVAFYPVCHPRGFSVATALGAQ